PGHPDVYATGRDSPGPGRARDAGETGRMDPGRQEVGKMTISSVTATSPPARQARTPLQKHVDFFDRNGDGQTRVWETCGGLRALGVGRLASAGAAVAINLLVGMKTGSPWYRCLTIQNDNIHMAKHGGDTDAYDESGNFVPSKFEAIFQRHDSDQDGALNAEEIDRMLIANNGGEKARLGSKAEFGLLLHLAGEDSPSGRVLTRQRLQEFYDGTLFYSLAGETPP
ncbi:MAG: caleosin family protein, partial [Candidatus Eremiobacterota bacterium]